MEYINLNGERINTPAHLNFCAKFGDVILLNGLHQLITGFGIYDNQMWTEKIYEDGCHLGAANYENVANAVIITDEASRERTIKAYKAAVIGNFKKFEPSYKDYITLDMIEEHLGQFT